MYTYVWKIYLKEKQIAPPLSSRLQVSPSSIELLSMEVLSIDCRDGLFFMFLKDTAKLDWERSRIKRPLQETRH